MLNRGGKLVHSTAGHGRVCSAQSMELGRMQSMRMCGRDGAMGSMLSLLGAFVWHVHGRGRAKIMLAWRTCDALSFSNLSWLYFWLRHTCRGYFWKQIYLQCSKSPHT